AGTLAARGRRGWRPCPFLAPVLALVAAAVLSGGSLASLRHWLPYVVAGVAACQVRPEAARSMLAPLLGVAAAACAYGLVTFGAFRLVGGRLNFRPPLDDMPLALVYPYYSGAVPRSGHLVGPFMNDLYFGVWVAALTGLLLGWRPRQAAAGLLGVLTV